MVAHADAVCGAGAVDLLLREGAAGTRGGAAARCSELLRRGFLRPSLPPPRAADGSEDALLLDAVPVAATAAATAAAAAGGFEDGAAFYSVDPVPRCVRALRGPGAGGTPAASATAAAAALRGGGGLRVSPEELAALTASLAGVEEELQAHLARTRKRSEMRRIAAAGGAAARRGGGGGAGGGARGPARAPDVAPVGSDVFSEL
jgi:hypothetical protein